VPAAGASTRPPLKTHGFAFQPTGSSAPAPVTVEAPLEEVAKSVPAKSTSSYPNMTPVSPAPSTAPTVKTTIGADGEEEKTAEDGANIVKVKKVKKK
jgi:hypothetical protein